MTAGSASPERGIAPQRVVAALARAAGGAPFTARLAGGRGRCAILRLDREGGPAAAWIELAPPVGPSPLAVTHAAAAWGPVLELAPAAPLAEVRFDGRRAALRPWVDLGPLPWDEAARGLAHALEQLADGPDAPFAAGVAADRFVPTRGAWADEWLARARASHTRAEQLGTDAGPLGRRLLERIDRGRDVLARAERFGLVHGDLGPHAIGLGPRGPELLSWERALVGDRQVDLAPLLVLGDGPLADLVGLAPTAFAQVDPERVELYHLGWCLHQLELVGEAVARGGLARLTAIDRVVAHASAAATPGWAAQRLDRARRRTGAPRPPLAHPPRTVHGLLQVILGALTGAAPPDPLWVAAELGAVLLADSLPPAEARALLAARTVVRAGPAPLHADRAPGPLPPLPSRGVAGLLALTGRAAIDRLGGAVSDGVLRGLERSVRAAVRLDAPASPVLDALVALAEGDPRGEELLWDAARGIDPRVDRRPLGSIDALARAAGGDDLGALVVWLLARSDASAVPGGGAFWLEHGRRVRLTSPKCG